MITSPNRNIGSRRHPWAVTKNAKEANLFRTLLNAFLRKVFEDSCKYRILACIISKKEGGNKKKKKKMKALRFCQSQCDLRGSPLKWMTVLKLTGGLAPGIVVGNNSSSPAKDQFVLLQFPFLLPDLSVLCRVVFELF